MRDITVLMKAMSEGNRLRIINALMNQGDMCACQIIELLDVSGATVSRHMDVLVRAGLVKSRRDGKWVHYSLASPGTADPVLEWLRERFEESARAKNDIKVLEKITALDREALCGKQKIGESCL